MKCSKCNIFNFHAANKQLIKKNLPFLKVRQLPKTQMDVMNDRVINIPISDDDLIRNVTSLPRLNNNSGFINLKMKRKLKYKTYYKMQTVRPKVVYDSVLYLKENNPFYRNVKIIPYEEFVKNCQDDVAEAETEKDEDENMEDEGMKDVSMKGESVEDKNVEEEKKALKPRRLILKEQ